MPTQVFIDNINMETQTTFHNNGSINIYPLDFELGQKIVSGATVASQKGRMTTDDDGRSKFMPYAHNSGSRYTPLMRTEHGEMKMTQQDIKIGFSFRKSLTAAQITALLQQEVEEMSQYMYNVPFTMYNLADARG